MREYTITHEGANGYPFTRTWKLALFTSLPPRLQAIVRAENMAAAHDAYVAYRPLADTRARRKLAQEWERVISGKRMITLELSNHSGECYESVTLDQPEAGFAEWLIRKDKEGCPVSFNGPGERLAVKVRESYKAQQEAEERLQKKREEEVRAEQERQDKADAELLSQFTKAKFKRGAYFPLLDGEQKIEIPGLIYGSLIVHRGKDNRSGWRVAHVKSGLLLRAGIDTQRDAKMIAFRCAKYFPDAKLPPCFLNKKEDRDYMFEVMRNPFRAC